MKPTECVEAYIRDWHQCWLKHGGDEGLDWRAGAEAIDAAMEEWAKDLKKAAGVHWAKGCADPSATVLGTQPEHEPTVEKVCRSIVNGAKATVETIRDPRHPPSFREYELRRILGEWKITKVLVFFDDDGDQILEVAALEKRLRKPKFRVVKQPPVSRDDPNCELLFKAGHLFKGALMSGEEAVRVRRVGKLSLPSGTIIVRDFGYPPDEGLPLSLRVPPGNYEVEVACLDRCIAAVRVVFARTGRRPFKYRKAVEVGSDSSSIGVDAGNVSICDARAFLSRTKRQHERDYEAWCETSLGESQKASGAVFLKLGDSKACNAVVVNSGHGDGGYPAYWVFDSKNKLVALVVDFLVAAEFLSRTLKLPWLAGATGEIFSETKAGGMRVRIDRTKAPGLVVSGGSVNEVRWLDRNGAIVGTNKDVGSWNSGDEQGWYVDLNKLDRLASEMEIVLYTGYRNT